MEKNQFSTRINADICNFQWCNAEPRMVWHYNFLIHDITCITCWFLVCAQFLLPYIYLYHSYTQPDASFPEILVIMHFAVMLPQGTEFAANLMPSPSCCTC